MPNLDHDTITELVDLLCPVMASEPERRAILTQALIGSPLLQDVNYTGPVRAFVIELIRQLNDFGEVVPGRPALSAVLEVVRGRVGVDKQRRIDKLLGNVRIKSGLDRATIVELVDLLRPLMASEPDRRAILMLALGNSPLLGSINYTGPVDSFCLLLVQQLHDFGEVAPGTPALWTLLETVRDRIGVDKQQCIDKLRHTLTLHF